MSADKITAGTAWCAWLNQQKSGRTKLYLTRKGAWTLDPNEAERFPNEEMARNRLGKRKGKPVLFAQE